MSKSLSRVALARNVICAIIIYLYVILSNNGWNISEIQYLSAFSSILGIFLFVTLINFGINVFINKRNVDV